MASTLTHLRPCLPWVPWIEPCVKSSCTQELACICRTSYSQCTGHMDVSSTHTQTSSQVELPCSAWGCGPASSWGKTGLVQACEHSPPGSCVGPSFSSTLHEAGFSSLIQPKQHFKQLRAGMRALLSTVKPDLKQICRSVKSGQSFHSTRLSSKYSCYP